ncbi:SDR family oxidoreductase [Rhizorhabdus wittichii]|uniref:SDR family oxidoreductase n=1 Tax=Rhizorhabdus wittichii TaxID=160791 RepID=A0A975D228_9SPHN|nr:SDR family oxidoreductase [Rhizorhabdus wittichii]QTH21199.1 SDR family oxidoreductase [Rhizorhabdus wittichii]
MIELAGGRALVTGGAGTLGKALARVLLDRGMAVLLTDRDEDRLRDAIARLGHPKDLDWRVLDVADPQGWAALGEAIDADVAPIRLLVNNACPPSARRPLTEIAPADWQSLIAAGLTGPFLGVRTFAPRMAASGGGHILNIASMAALGPLPDHGDYAAAKAGLLSLSETLRIELADSGVGVSVACPGAIGHPLGHAGCAADPAAAPGRMDPVAGMGFVIDAMQAGRFLILTHGDGADAIACRADEIAVAFDRAAQGGPARTR